MSKNPAQNIEADEFTHAFLSFCTFVSLLNGKKSAFRDVVILNSASALLATGNASNLEEAATKAIESIDNGKALEKLNMLINMTND